MRQRVKGTEGRRKECQGSISLSLTIPRQVSEGAYFLHVPLSHERLMPTAVFFSGNSGIRVPRFAEPLGKAQGRPIILDEYKGISRTQYCDP